MFEDRMNGVDLRVPVASRGSWWRARWQLESRVNSSHDMVGGRRFPEMRSTRFVVLNQRNGRSGHNDSGQVQS